MSGEMPMDPENMGVESEQTGAETGLAAEQGVPTEVPVSGGETGSLGGESTGSPSQTEPAKKPAPHISPKPLVHPSTPNGEGFIKTGGEVGKAMGEELDILGPVTGKGTSELL